MIALTATNFFAIWQELNKLLADAPAVDVGEWQAIRNAPQSKTIEIEDVSFSMHVPDNMTGLQMAIDPNLPWAEEHFQERVSGIPYNPPPSHMRWPYRQEDNKDHLEGHHFSHTYPERFWPKWANSMTDQIGYQIKNAGIRYDYGDLHDLVELLKARPNTRQAYLPVWFPEDLHATHFEARVPCTLGYHFMIREGFLKCVYYIRSCDLYRHFRDDVYMAARLQQWVADEVGVGVRHLTMHISSLHIFEPERARARNETGDPLTQAKWW